MMRAGHRQLRQFKWALGHLGLTTAQIFEIIPDGRPARRRTPETPETPGSSSDDEGSGPIPEAV